MKRLQVLFLAALSSSLFLFGCGKDTEELNTQPAASPTQAAASGETDKDGPAGSPDTTETPPADNMVRSRITNEWVDASVDQTRPIAVMIPNTKTASHYGLSKASVLYECSVENDITRLMAIFDDWNDMDKLGNIRSSRDYFIYWAFEWDAIHIHYGGPFYIDDLVARTDTQNIDCISYQNASYKDSAKNTVDNAFTDTGRIKKAADHYGYPLKYREDYSDEQHYLFAPDNAPNTLTQYPGSVTASEIDMSPAYPVTNPYFIYNEKTGLYDRYQHLMGDSYGPHVDLENGEQLAFKNILVQNTYYEVRDQKDYLSYQCHDNTRDGWFFTNGRGIHVTWEKGSDYGATKYYDDDGNEIRLNTGRTMVCILKEGDTFLADGTVMNDE